MSLRLATDIAALASAVCAFAWSWHGVQVAGICGTVLVGWILGHYARSGIAARTPQQAQLTARVGFRRKARILAGMIPECIVFGAWPVVVLFRIREESWVAALAAAGGIAVGILLARLTRRTTGTPPTRPAPTLAAPDAD